MKRKTYVSAFFVVSIITGTLAWELLEVLLQNAGVHVDISAGPIGFDVDVLSMYVRINPGTFIGLLIAYLRYRATT